MTATFFHDGDLAAGEIVTLSDDAAHHARVRRVEPDEPLRVTNGRGTLASARLERLDKKAFEVRVTGVTRVAPPLAITLCVPVGDRDRMLWLAEKATELQVTRWLPVLWSRSRNVNPRGDGAAFSEKVRIRTISALEQSGGAWLPRIEPTIEPSALASPELDGARLLLDASGDAMTFTGVAAPTTIALGPEGGLTDDERRALIDAGWRTWRLASTTLRFETAAIAAVAVVRATSLGPAAHG